MHQVMSQIERVRVLNTPVDVIDMTGALEFIDRLIQSNSTGNYILAVNPEKVNVLHKDVFLKGMFENAALLLPDGIGVVMAVRLLFGRKIGRVPGADLMLNLCSVASRRSYRIFVYGSKEETNERAVEKLKEKYQGLKIVGRCNGYISEDKMDELVNEINNSGAEILFIALGSPKQEKWMQLYLPKLNVKVCQSIGGTLDTIAGNVKRAPVLFQRLGLEWFYRLVKEPKRIRRQIVLPVFALKVLREKFRSN